MLNTCRLSEAHSLAHAMHGIYTLKQVQAKIGSTWQASAALASKAKPEHGWCSWI